MQRMGKVGILVAGLLLVGAATADAQTWPDRRAESDAGLQWMVGSYFPMSGLGSFGGYDLHMDPWAVVGLSLRPGENDSRFRPRFEILVVPEVAMRRNPRAGIVQRSDGAATNADGSAGASEGGSAGSSSDGAEACDGCTSDSFRLTLINSRFMVDATFPFVRESRAYLTGGASMRFQLSDPDECAAESGGECALPQFARARIDPGVVAGLGWEPANSTLQAVQLTGRVSLYGRSERALAAPQQWLPELELTFRFAPFWMR